MYSRSALTENNAKQIYFKTLLPHSKNLGSSITSCLSGTHVNRLEQKSEQTSLREGKRRQREPDLTTGGIKQSVMFSDVFGRKTTQCKF